MAKGYYMVNIRLNVEAESIRDAYHKISEKMSPLAEETFSWETTSEWYNPDGEPIGTSEVSEAILSVLAEKSVANEAK